MLPWTDDLATDAGVLRPERSTIISPAIREPSENASLFRLVSDSTCGTVPSVAERGLCSIVKSESSPSFLFLVVPGGSWTEMKCNGYNLNLTTGRATKTFYLIRNMYVKISFL